MGQRKSLFGLFVVALVLAAPSLAAPVAAQDSSAVAVNTKDDSSVFKFAFSIKKVAGDVVDPQNAAVAAASCTNCETVAVAIQVVLVSGDPDVVAPENVAIAYNEDCDVCATLAMAFQFVFGTGDEPVHFTKAGRDKLKEIKRQFKDLKQADLSVEEVEARVMALAQQVADVVTAELVAGPPGQVEATSSTTTSTSATTLATTTTTAGDGGTVTTVGSSPSTTAGTAPATSTTSAPAGTTTTSIP